VIAIANECERARLALAPRLTATAKLRRCLTQQSGAGDKAGILNQRPPGKIGAEEFHNAEITVHGFGHHGRIIGSLLTPTPSSAKTLAVALDVKGYGSASRELSFAHFSAIQTIDVNSVTYADGSTCHASSAGACSVAPSLFMRISAQ
jgi:hypothetical protein